MNLVDIVNMRLEAEMKCSKDRDKIALLEDEIAQMAENSLDLRQEIDYWQSKFEQQRERANRLRESLQWYGSLKNYRDYRPGDEDEATDFWVPDQGIRARNALSNDTYD